MHIIHLAEVDSTQLYARRWLVDGGSPSATAILADHQTEGQGQWGRSWTSLPGNLQATYIIPAQLFEPQYYPVIGLRVAEALCQELLAYPLRIKWPNDIFIETPGHAQKCGGILCEVMDHHILIGVGLNITNAPQGAGCLDACLPYAGATYTLCEKLGQRILNMDMTCPWNIPPLIYQASWIDYTPPSGKPFDVYVEGLSPDGALMVRGINGNPMKLNDGRLGIARTGLAGTCT